MRSGLPLTLLTGLAIATALQAGDKKETDRLSGTWIVTSIEQAGARTPEDTVKQLDLKLILKGDKYETYSGAKNQEKGTFAVNATRTPKTFDIKADDGPNQGKTIFAIYELKGDELKACYDIEGKAYPKAFETKPGTQLVMVVYKKQK